MPQRPSSLYSEALLLMQKNFLALLLFTLASAAQSQGAAVTYPPKLAEAAKQAYLLGYVPGAKEKAFALTPDGQHFSAVFGLETAEQAARAASMRCLRAHGVPCRVWRINGDEVLPAYAAATKQSASALAKLPANLSGTVFGGEDLDGKVPATSSLRSGAEVHGATPMDAPRGSKTILTIDLVKLYKAEPKLVVLDVLHAKSFKKSTLPQTSWIYGAGWEDSALNKDIKANLVKAMRSIARSKDTPIVTYCSNRDCWLSWNAAMRLVESGYKRVYWYRGGLEAWHAAQLPLVDTPIAAQLW